MSEGEAPDPDTTLQSMGAGRRGGGAGPRSYLLVLGGGSSWLYHLPASGAGLVGRAPDAALRLADGSVSRRHARLTLATGGEVVLADLGSHNGTRVNGEALAGPRTLASGDTIAIGDFTLVLHTVARPPVAQRLVDDATLRQRLDAEIERALRSDRPLSLVALSLGGTHLARDAVEAALLPRLSRIDVGGWLDDGQLLVLLPEQAPDAAGEAATRLLEAVTAVTPTARAGLATCPDDGCDPEALVGAARAAAATAGAGALAGASATATRITLDDRSILVADPAMTRIYEFIRRVAASDLPVLISGETGVGKENAAFAVHTWSPRSAGPFVTVNCAALPENLVESELFGHEKGAFSSAHAAKPGLLETAVGGTVFLDEVGELPLAAQAKLLRALEAKRIARVGSVREKEIDIRVVAATNRDLDAEVASGRFRQDLFFRLSAVTVIVPPLRDRPREVAVLARTFLDEACARARRDPMAIGAATMQRLARYGWPGNVRELKNVMEYAAAAIPDSVLEPWHLPARVLGDRDPPAAAPAPPPRPVRPVAADATLAPPAPDAPTDAPADPGASAAAPSDEDPDPTAAPPDRATAEPATPARFRPIGEELRDLERRRIREALDAAGGVQTRAAELLGMPLRTLVLRIKQYGLSNRGRPSSDP